jgi:bifunctional non-homologous end joining protein LigD
LSEHVRGKGPAFHQRACALGLEGIVSKRAQAPYRPGRGESWIKVKCQQRQELVVGGWTDPRGSRSGIGALVLGYHEDGALRYAGKVGTGYTARDLEMLHELLAPRERGEPPFVDPPRGAAARTMHWVKPDVVVEVEFTEWTREGQLRHPSFKGVREDKPAAEIVRERPQEGGVATRADGDEGGRPTTVLGQRLTNPGRVLWPGQGITKLALARYYEAIADWMLPHVALRPLSLVRCPRGAGAPCFFQKHPGDQVPDILGRIAIAEKKKTSEYVYLDSAAGLIALVQIATLEVHAWGSRSDRVERPDLMIFDLDPDPALAWDRVVEAARELRERLESLGLASWVKTTGGKGLHVVAPLGRRQEFDEVREFSRRIAEQMARDAPARYVATMSKAKRKGRIFVDYLRNGRGSTAIVPYSSRVFDGAPVSVPVRWEELDRDIRADPFTVETLPRRLARLKRDPWEGFLETRQTITKKMWASLER